MTKTFQFKESTENRFYYALIGESQPLICKSFTKLITGFEDYCEHLPKTMSISVSTDRVHSKGWKKIDVTETTPYTGYIRVSGKFIKSISGIWHLYLSATALKYGLGSIFWIKVTLGSNA